MKKINNIGKTEYKKILDLIKKNGLSYYNVEKDDFIYYEDNGEMIAFGRIFEIGKNEFELSSLWVSKKYRGNKLGIKLIKDLINEKLPNNSNLFLACKRELENYYKNAGFKIINKNIPEKLFYTLKWAKENNFDAIIMKYFNN